jgi:hypothetical protein
MATGKLEKKYTVDFLGLEIPLFRTVPTGDFIRTVYKNSLEIGGLKLPVAVTTSVFSEYKDTPVVFSKTQAEYEAKAQLASKENTELSNAKITGKSYHEKANASSLTIAADYNCEEDIAYEEEVILGEK